MTPVEAPKARIRPLSHRSLARYLNSHLVCRFKPIVRPALLAVPSASVVQQFNDEVDCPLWVVSQQRKENPPYGTRWEGVKVRMLLYAENRLDVDRASAAPIISVQVLLVE